MNGYVVCGLVLLIGGCGPALVLSSRGSPVERLVGLSMTGSIITLFLLVLAQITGQSFYLTVPLVLVPLSLAGALVFTRLLGKRPET